MSIPIAVLVGVFSSLVALLLAGVVVRKYVASALYSISGSALFGHGVECKYSNQRDAQNHMKKCMDESDTVRVLCMRGDSISGPHGPFQFLLSQEKTKCKFLLADPGNGSANNPHISRRAEEINEQPDRYRKYIELSVANIEEKASRQDNLSCRLHQVPASCRLYLCDSHAFISFFRKGVMGAEMPVIVARQSSPIYAGMLRQFDQIWENSRVPDGMNSEEVVNASH